MNLQAIAYLILTPATLLLLAVPACGQDSGSFVYKRIDTVALKMRVYYPECDMGTETPSAALIFFHGGGWINRDQEQFAPHAKYFARRGLVCFLVEYRVQSIHHTEPEDALEDARSAVGYIRRHAVRFGISPDKLVAAGGSAGGHLAAATALIKGFDSATDNLETPCEPNALILFNPVLDNSPAGYGYERIGNTYRQFSPLHNIRQGAPPTIIFHGGKDELVPMETIRFFCSSLNRLGTNCRLVEYPEAGHGFFNYENRKYYLHTLAGMNDFLVEKGFLLPHK